MKTLIEKKRANKPAGLLTYSSESKLEKSTYSPIQDYLENDFRKLVKAYLQKKHKKDNA
jgi:hypothetical protein